MAVPLRSEWASVWRRDRGIPARMRFATLVVGVLIVSGRALGAGSDAAEAAIKRGIELRKKGDDEQALREFTQAYQLSKSPRALAQMGVAEQALGRWVDAEVHVERALQASSDGWIQ